MRGEMEENKNGKSKWQKGWKQETGIGMMKVSGKPISSPGRSEKFPPPLMRFMRSNGGSRSRRCRSSPMFVRKRNIESQEPSSPKVTCMGQVRVSPTKPHNPPGPTCCWIPRPNSPLCRCHCPVWPFFFRRRNSKHSNYRQDQPDSVFPHTLNADNHAFVSTPTSSTPPTYALLLTRSRSAPYRSSSLATRFWASPVNTPHKTPPLDSPQKLQPADSQPLSASASASASPPPLLTRCKSEPAATGHRLVNTFWKKTRFQFD
ncbi:hypothetical protein Fmac_006318 [Flemingia macrophylla]|uniref:Uncharacterized protein n=1 Tax=Flemingia macrophylla TaxID=520843 RepID=A0ABD1NBQ9_9FABA